MGHLVAAPDKFRGTASALQVAEAAAKGARRAGWTAEAIPMADGGEGLVEVLGGELHRCLVTAPDGRRRVEARWSLLQAHGTAVIEMAQAAGLSLAGGAGSNNPLTATTAGVGELILAAVRAGAHRVVVGCGGSATTDGGSGAVRVIEAPSRLEGVELIAAVDVTTGFLDAAAVFAPQKGASPAQVTELTRRLHDVAHRYRQGFGVDVTSIRGSGAAGGLAGGLAALGARIVPGFDLVAEMVDLRHRVERADVVMTGEGHLDATSLAGKVVGGVLTVTPPTVPILCVIGDRDPAVDLQALEHAGPACGRLQVRVVQLVELAGPEQARTEVVDLVAEVVRQEMSAFDLHP